jgi:uncharacterized membrane protein
MTAFPPPVLPYMPQLIVHIGAGIVAIITGYVAVLAAKGERVHRKFGTVFVIAMLVMGSMASYLAISLQDVMVGQKGNIAAGFLVIYLVASAWMTVRRKEGTVGLFEQFALLIPVGVAAVFLIWGLQATLSPTGKLSGYAAPFYYGPAGLAAFFVALDLKVILKGGVSGVQRIARHLWRMCFALFGAAASFFIGQQKVMPVWMHGAWYLYVLGLAPLAFMIFWLIRVRMTNWYEGKRSSMARMHRGHEAAPL